MVRPMAATAKPRKLRDVSPSWAATCRGYHRLHIGPLIGHVKAGALGADVLDSFYAELRRCRAHCGRRA
jgi:integrase